MNKADREEMSDLLAYEEQSQYFSKHEVPVQMFVPESVTLTMTKWDLDGLCQAQLDKLIAAGWKSPEEASKFLDDHVKITNRVVEQDRADERREIGKWLIREDGYACEETIDALLRGERP